MSHRLIFSVAFTGCWLLAIVLRLYDLQIRKHQGYSEQAARQQQQVVTLDPPRGTIYDARQRELAVSVEVQSAFADPGKVEDPLATAEAVASVLKVDTASLARSLDSDRAFAWVQRKLDPPRAAKLEALEIPGIYFAPESKRYYPLRSLAAQILGYVGTDNQGLAGLEALYDQVVASEPGKRRVVRDAKRGTVLYPGLENAEPTPGRDLHLSLDAAIQQLVERELADAVEREGARSATAVLMDPRTGAILAMASAPSYDPNRFGEVPKERWRIPAVMDAYEPGSTFKMITLAAALDAGLVDPVEVIDCEMGSTRVARTLIRDHKPFGLLTVREIIARSSNVGAIKLGLRVGRDRLHAAASAFGFGRTTEVDLPGESAGILWPAERWSSLSTANVAFGQGVSITVLQLTRAFAAVANGGWMVKPWVVAAIGDTPRQQPPPQRLAIAPSTLREVRSILETVVLEGTATRASMSGFRAAGKTGTAQKAEPGKGYLPNRYIASFVGFAPIEDPTVVAAVILDEPWPRYHGGETAAPIFARIVEQVLLYHGVRPRREMPEQWPGEKKVTPPSQRADRGMRLASQQLDSEPEAAPPPGTVPSFAGLSAREAVARGGRYGLDLSLDGHGQVHKQSPAAGEPLESAGGLVRLWLAMEGG